MVKPPGFELRIFQLSPEFYHFSQLFREIQSNIKFNLKLARYSHLLQNGGL
jgi:hypothetical protein